MKKELDFVQKNSPLKKCNKTLLREAAQERWPEDIILQGAYKTLTEEYNCFTKVPQKSKSFLKIKECKVVSITDTEALRLIVPEHYKRCILIKGVRIHQNYFLPKEFLGEKLLLSVKITEKISYGKRELVIDYSLPKNRKKEYILKIGTPKAEGEKVFKIKDECYITLVKSNFLPKTS